MFIAEIEEYKNVITDVLSERIENLLRQHDHKAYLTNFFSPSGLRNFYVGSKVLRPDNSYVSKYLTRFLIKNKALYFNKNVLEIGTGSGIQSISMSINGAKNIIATDISRYALYSAKENVMRFNLSKRILLLQGDLFNCLDPFTKFDFAIFNHPFFYGKPNLVESFESAILDDRELAGIFLENIWSFLTFSGNVIMPYSSICGEHNNPIKFSNQLGIEHKILFTTQDKDGEHQIILFYKSHN